MKFGKQLEEYELPEWRGHYIPYRRLKNELGEIKGVAMTPPMTPVLHEESGKPLAGRRKESGLLSQIRIGRSGSECSNNSRGDLAGGVVIEEQNREEEWREKLVREATRVGDFVQRGIEGLQAQMRDLDKMARSLSKKRLMSSPTAVDAPMGGEGSSPKAKASKEKKKKKAKAAEDSDGSDDDGAGAGEFLELRVLEAVGLVAEGGRRLRGFAELNHAALYKILKKHDKMLGVSTGLCSLFPRLVEQTGLGDMARFDTLEAELRELSLHNTQTEGLNASAEVARLAAGLGMGPARTGGAPANSHTELVLSFFLGCSASLFLCIGVLLALPEASPKTYSEAYFLTPMPVFRVVFSVLLVMWCLGAVARTCDKMDINHMFILNVDPRCRVTPEFFFCRAATLTTLWILIFGMYVVDYKWRVLPTIWASQSVNKRSSLHFVMYPVFLLLLAMLGMIWPSRICRNRYKAAVCRSIGRTASAPFHPVDFADNMVGDVLTSLAKPLQDVPAAFCYLLSAHPQPEDAVRRFVEKGDTCRYWEHHMLLPVIGGLPYVFRALQCLRRYRDTRETRHLWNFGKYMSSLLVVVVSSVWYEQIGAVAVVSLVATMYACIWDVVLDWGLGSNEIFGACIQDRARDLSGGGQVVAQPHDRHFQPPVYMLCSVLDLLARSTWALTLMPTSIISRNLVGRVVLVSLISSIEIIRRSIWAVLRIEYEQVANASGFRALLWVPSKLHQAGAAGGLRTTSNSLRQPLLESPGRP